MSADPQSFRDIFYRLSGYPPMRWQDRLFCQLINGKFPSALDLPTGLGKTSVMAIWLVARALAREDALKAIPRRLVYIVDRRAVVDQATEEAEKLRDALDCNDNPESKAGHLKGLPPDEKAQAFATLRALAANLGVHDRRKLPISTLRGQHADNRDWQADPASPAIIVGTVDMIGSRLLFEGYGVSRKMRPYHAGLLGADTLIVLDEAHLVPPFTHLLRTIEGGASLWPKDEDSHWREDIALRPPFVVLPLSATQREQPTENDNRKPFSLQEEDISHDDFAEQRINARKMLCLDPPVAKDWDAALAAKAWELAAKDGGCARVSVFCNRRDKKDDESTGPSVMGVLAELEKLDKRDKFAFEYELLVGGQRAKERQKAADSLKRLGFAGSGERPAGPDRPTFLLATSAGEVGVDFDADHMICDLAPWERMVQRLGRVNRRGGKGRQATVVVLDTSQTEKKDEDRRERLENTLALLQRIGEGEQLSSAALNALRKEAGEAAIDAASTPEPLRPSLTRALVDAWSMTSLEQHTGRPDVAPWLRGWVEPDNQTIVIWRAHLPVRTDENGKPVAPTKTEVEAFFEAAPPHESEKLETETFRVVNWLMDRAKKVLAGASSVTADDVNDEEAASKDPAADQTEEAQELPVRKLKQENVVAYVLSSAGDYQKRYSLRDLRDDPNKRLKGDLEAALSGATLVVDAQFGGLKDGMLEKDSDRLPEATDTDEAWSKEAGFRVRLSNPQKEKGEQEKEERRENERKFWRPEFRFVVRRSGDTGDPAEWLVVEHYKDRAQSEDGRSVRNVPQELGEHQSRAEQKAWDIASKIGLSGPAAEALAVAAFLHDEGKRASRWQRAFRAPHEKDEAGAYKIFAKTRGPINQQILDGYRHEFGSLPYAEAHARFKSLPEDWRSLVLHLIAAHHGQARPSIPTRGCEDAPPSALEERAREVALRFARLQKRWGPWGLAWWEALLRAADQQASRDNDRGEGLGASRGEGK